ncbi:exopolysaccharide production protein ExoZ [Rhizomicrobium palustre]|uniref:Exopolysaccharide production protein ExoZ n=1 Tax=Rhizomicrobium palustre TaxID=189966 RepID=A0A846N247_9PROT|nr:acyltransferase [Rhizomicrobium palustre]NIK90018.1 exopolysaccharide production protein ExoZ [Rhizomicrobium palustre]
MTITQVVGETRPSPASAQPIKNANIQVLRAVAALGVVFHHSMHALEDSAPGHFQWNWSFGAYGVEIFFVISGYIMMMVTSAKEKTAGSFLTARLIRILPLYYLLTAFVIVLKITGLAHFGNDPITPAWAAKSFLFLPFTKADMPSSPILFPGWTLNYEMMFYLLFAASLMVRSETLRVKIVIASIAAAFLLPWIWSTPLTRYFGSEVITGFAFGVALWPLTQKLRLTPAIATALIVAGVAAMAAIDHNHLNDTPLMGAALSLAAAAIVAGAIFLERGGLSVKNRALVGLGDASYALYLVHPIVIAVIAHLAAKAHVGPVAMVLTMIAASLAVAVVMYEKLDRPLHEGLRRLTR